VDADTLGLAHVLMKVRNDVTFCGDSGSRRKPLRDLPPAEIQATATPDEEWIPKVTQAGLAIITRDRSIEMRLNEKDIVLASSARMFAITSEGQLDNWGLLEVVVTRWRDMEKAAEEDGPYIYAVTRSTLRKIELAPPGVQSPAREGKRDAVHARTRA
jgi:hypothetical protein